MVTKEEKYARLRLYRSDNIGNATYWTLMGLYGSAISAISNLSVILSKENAPSYKLSSLDSIEKEIASLKKIGAKLVFYEDDLYPPLLKFVENPPPILTVLGNYEAYKQLLSRKLLSVVGSRNASLNNLTLCSSICAELSECGIGIVSGFARGIDTSAHNGSLAYGTIAVLAGGINQIYPPENKILYREIIKTGALITEMPYDTYPKSNFFPRRNSIIAGMSDATLVVEAAERSGSLITAKMAKTFNRKLFVVPNSPLDTRGKGSNALIKAGAHVVTQSQDILEELGKDGHCYIFEKKDVNRSVTKIQYKYHPKSINEIKNVILKLLDAYSIDVSEVFSVISAPTNNILHALVELEIAGKVTRIHGNKITYIK